MDNKFRVEYDDSPDQIIDTIGSILREFHGLKIITISDPDSDGYVDYKIVKMSEYENC